MISFFFLLLTSLDFSDFSFKQSLIEGSSSAAGFWACRRTLKQMNRGRRTSTRKTNKTPSCPTLSPIATTHANVDIANVDDADDANQQGIRTRSRAKDVGRQDPFAEDIVSPKKQTAKNLRKTRKPAETTKSNGKAVLTGKDVVKDLAVKELVKNVKLSATNIEAKDNIETKDNAKDTAVENVALDEVTSNTIDSGLENCPCGNSVDHECKWICCSKCNQWWHLNCAGILESEFKKFKQCYFKCIS